MTQTPEPLFKRVHPEPKVRVAQGRSMQVSQFVPVAEEDGTLFRIMCPVNGRVDDISLFVDSRMDAPVELVCSVKSVDFSTVSWPVKVSAGYTDATEGFAVTKGARVFVALKNLADREKLTQVWLSATLTPE